MKNTPSSPARIVIASRESRLALWQAKHIQERLAELHPQCQVEILGMTTRGDQILDRPLSQIGGKGLFIKELEVAMAEGRADLVALARAMLFNPRWPWHAAAKLGARVSAPPQYWRSQPQGLKGLFGDARIGMR